MLPTLPLPMIGALILAFLCVSRIYAERRFSALSGPIAVCALQSALIALVAHYGFIELRFVQAVLASAIAPLAWVALSQSGLEMRRKAWVHLAAPVLAFIAVWVQPYALDVMIPLLFLGYGTAILFAVARGGDALPGVRLESGDQSGRIWRWIGGALIASALSDVAIVAAIIAGFPEVQSLIIAFGSSGMLLLLGALSLSRSLGDVPEPISRSEPEENGTRAEDAQIMETLDALMQEGKLYLDPDLTLTRLARRMGLPVKTLSAAINRATGENVSRYINARRIKAACAALDQGESVTQAMLNAGFNTKSNFNREFLRLTGQTPRAYRG